MFYTLISFSNKLMIFEFCDTAKSYAIFVPLFVSRVSLTSYYSVLDISPRNCSVIGIIIKDAHRALSNHCSISFNVCSRACTTYSVRANTVIKFIKIKLQSISISPRIILSVQYSQYFRIQRLQFGYHFITHIVKFRMVTE